MVIFREQKKYEKNTVDETLWESIGKVNFSVKVGFAVDIGTTTVVVTAVDFERKKIIGTLSQTNEQTKLGADVMMRIMHCMSGKGEVLHGMVIRQIEEMAMLLSGKKEVEELKGEQCCFFVVDIFNLSLYIR